jgi:hypothetical protein
MRRRSHNQLVLDLDRGGRQHPPPPPSGELLQALADLLLEALGGQRNLTSPEPEVCDASQDHS